MYIKNTYIKNSNKSSHTYIFENQFVNNELTKLTKLTKKYKHIQITQQLLKILEKFKIFNLNGFFHENMQNSVNIYLDTNSKLFVNINNYYKPDDYIKIVDICIDLAKIVSYIENNITNTNTEISDNDIYSQIFAEVKKILLDLYNSGKINFYDGTDNRIIFFKTKGRVFKCSDLKNIHRIHLTNIERINKAKTDYPKYKDKLNILEKLISNYKENYEKIQDIYTEINNRNKNVILILNGIYFNSFDFLIDGFKITIFRYN